VGWRGTWVVYCGNLVRAFWFRLWSLIPRENDGFEYGEGGKASHPQTEAWKGRGVVS
jgi:hypothetical protein